MERDDASQEPVDPRVLLANERTYLAWIRTSLAFVGAGAIVARLFPPFEVPGFRVALGIALVAFGLAIAVASYLRYRQADRALTTGRVLPHSPLPLALLIGSAGAGIALLVMLSR